MTLTAQIIQTVLTAIVLCLSSMAVQGQEQSLAANSTINGIVVYSDTGRPLRHARIMLVPEVDGWEQTAVSDLRGRFVFQNVPAGRCRLTIDAPGLLTGLRIIPRNTPFRNRRFPIRSDLVTEVTVNGTDSVEVKLQAVRGGVITGRVVTEDDQPLINADIKLLYRENGKWLPEAGTWAQYREQVAGERKTDASGVYRIAGLPSGDYLVRVSEPVLGDDRIPGDEDSYYDGSFMVAYYPAATGVKDAQPVSVVEGSESKGIDIRMTERAPHTLMGTVTVGPEKTPGTGVAVTIERSDEIGYTTSTLEGSTRSDEEGRWRLPGLPPGEYLVSIGGSVRIVSGELASWIETPHKRTRVLIQDKKITVLETKLSLGAHVGGRAMLNGKPFDEEWGAYLGVGLDDKSATTKSAEAESGFHMGLLRTKGMFDINGIPAGTYLFHVYIREDDKGYVKSVTRKGVDLMQTPFKLTDGLSYDDVVITLATDLANVEGQVTLAEKQPPSDVVVIIVPANDVTRRFSSGPRSVDPDAQGKISFKAAPGEYFIAAITMAHYKKLEPQLNYEYFDKNAAKLQRIKLRAGEKLKWGKLELISLP